MINSWKSINPQIGIGYGAYLIIDEVEFLSDKIEQHIKVKKFVNSSLNNHIISYIFS